jgi:hypothetical protein
MVEPYARRLKGEFMVNQAELGKKGVIEFSYNQDIG